MADDDDWQADIEEQAVFLGMDLNTDREFLWYDPLKCGVHC
jgi:hypothetical protein